MGVSAQLQDSSLLLPSCCREEGLGAQVRVVAPQLRGRRRLDNESTLQLSSLVRAHDAALAHVSDSSVVYAEEDLLARLQVSQKEAALSH